jgi:16S rRNA (adenine1518-N6/adenine1519-N6)-dimethyltransferase
MSYKEFGIPLKKKFGQHFLKENWVIDSIIKNVELNNTSSVFEIGGGSGFLTSAILTKNVARLWVFEIDNEWAIFLKTNIKDKRLKVIEDNILDIDFSIFQECPPWTLLSNLPYQITFPILYLLQKNMHVLKEGVIMVQEEVAQKILKTSGRDYGYISLFFQYYFQWKMLDKIPPEAFNPPPKVYSRLLYFKPKFERIEIPNEEMFWKFIKICFKSPRRTLKNNLAQSHYDLSKISDVLMLRAQQIDMSNFLNIWKRLN